MFNNLNLIGLNGDVLDGNVSYEGEAYTVTSGQVFATGRLAQAGLNHEVVAGYSYSRMNYPEGPYTRLADVVGNIFAPISVGASPLPNDTGPPTAHATQHSLFVSDTISLTRQWSLLLCARYIDYVNDKPRDYPDSGVRLRYKTDATVPALAVMFKPTSTVTTYASWSKGFEQGAYAPGWADNAHQRLDPIESRQIELGVKARWHEGLMLSAAVFDIDKPLQAVSASDNIFRTQGRQRHRGIELMANGQLGPRLNGILGLAWLDAKQRETGDPDVDDKRPAGKPTIVRLSVFNVSDKRYWESVVYGTVGMARSRTVVLSVTTQF